MEIGKTGNLTDMPINHNDTQNRNAVAVHPTESVGVFDPSTLFPQDIGKNWKDLGEISSGGIPSKFAYAGNGIIIFGDVFSHIFRSIDYGSTWTDLGVVGNISYIGLVYAGDGILIFGDSDGHIFRSTEYGLTWTDLGVISTSSINSGCYAGRNGILVVGDLVGHIFRSTDYGLNWTDLGVISASGIYSSGFTYAGNGILVFGDIGSHIFRSTDHGLTWTDLGAISTVVIDSVIGYAGNGVLVFGDEAGHIFRSTDYGLNWTDLGVISASGISSGFTYAGNGIIIFGDQGGHIFRSTDYGLTWTDLGVISTAGIESGLVYAGNGIIVFGDNNGHVFRSDVAYKIDEAQVNFSRIRSDVTVSRALNTTYSNNDAVRTLHVTATVRCAISLDGGNAYIQGKAEVTAGDPAAVASGIVGIEAGLLNEDNSYEVNFYVMPGEKYRIDSSTTDGTVTLGKWFETYI